MGPEDTIDPDMNIVTINELIKAVQKSKSDADNTKVEQLIEILSFMDEDSDGVINVRQVMKIVELLSTTEANFSSKSIRQIVETLAKEELLETEENIEESMSLHSEYATAPDNSSIDIAYEENIDSIDSKNKNNGQLRKDIDMNVVDLKYEMKDKAIDINDQKSVSSIQGKSISDKNASFQIENEKKKISMK